MQTPANLFFIVFVVMHLFFINADPFIPHDFSRGAYTDEGLYVFQTFKTIFNQSLFISDSDCLLKTPFYNLFFAPFIAFGSLYLLRLIMLLFIAFCLALWIKSQDKKAALFPILLIGLAGMPTFFMHCHLALAEGFVLGMLLIALFFGTHKNKSLQIWSILCIGIAIGAKIQYSYLVVFCIPVIWSTGLKNLSLKKTVIVAVPFAVLGFLALVYQSEYQYILSNQSIGKFQNFGNWGERIKYNLATILTHLPMQLLFCFWILITTLSFWNWRKIPKKQGIILLILFVFLVIESHKLLLIYLPQRYLFLWFAAFVLILAHQLVILKNLYSINIKVFLIPLAAVFIAQYYFLLQTRQYDMAHAKKHLRQAVPKNATLIGPWAPSLALGTGIQVQTAWLDYYENLNTWSHKKGVYILAEIDQNDCDSLFYKKLSSKLYLKHLDTFKVKDWMLVLSVTEER